MKNLNSAINLFNFKSSTDFMTQSRKCCSHDKLSAIINRAQQKVESKKNVCVFSIKKQLSFPMQWDFYDAVRLKASIIIALANKNSHVSFRGIFILLKRKCLLNCIKPDWNVYMRVQLSSSLSAESEITENKWTS